MSYVTTKAQPDLLFVAANAADTFKEAAAIYLNGRSSGIIDTKRAIKQNALTAINMFRVQLEDRARKSNSTFASKTFKTAALFLEAFMEYLEDQGDEEVEIFETVVEKVNEFLIKARDNIKNTIRKWGNGDNG